MAIYLGNQTISDLERRTGYKFSVEDRKWLEQHRQDNANVTFDSDKFHIFDVPFEIHTGQKIQNELKNLLLKYQEISPSKEPLQFAVVTETDKQKEKRLKKEKEEKEWQEKLNNPNAIWNVKWHMLVPVKAQNIETGAIQDLYYGCFINTYTTGRDNIPVIINGYANISLTEEGFHGNFELNYPEIDSDADTHRDWNWVIGSNFYDLHGHYIGNIRNLVFDDTRFSLEDCIRLYEDVKSSSCKETHFFKYKEEN